MAKESCGTELKLAREALDRFYANNDEWPGIVGYRVTGATSPARLDGFDASGLPILVFAFYHQGDVLHVKCNPGTYAYLLSLSVIGNSFNINRRKQGSGNPHLRLRDEDNLTVARMVAGLEEGENVTFLDGNSLNLCHANIAPGARNARTMRDEVDAYAALLSGCSGNWGAFEGTEVEQFAARKELLHLATSRMREEREAALKARAA